MTEVIEPRNRLLNILDNLTLISDVYQQITEEEDIELIEVAKITTVVLNNIPFSYYYLMQRKFHYINKYNIVLKLIFSVKKIYNIENYIFRIFVMTGKLRCNNFKCNEYYCDNQFHYFNKKTDIEYSYKNIDANTLLLELENKIHDFISCEDCLKVWDTNSQYKQTNIDLEHTHICDNCIFIQHLNERTLDILDNCSICLKKMYCNNSISTECNHIFHKICLETWLKNKDTCPLCRSLCNI